MKQKLKKQILNSKKTKGSTLVALRVPDDLYRQIEGLKEETGESLTGVILFLVKKGLDS